MAEACRVVAGARAANGAPGTLIAGLRRTGDRCPAGDAGSDDRPACSAPMSSSSCGAGARLATSSSSTIAAHRVDTIRQAIGGRGRPHPPAAAPPPRSEPDRAAVRQAQGVFCARPPRKGERTLRGHRLPPRCRQPDGQLPQPPPTWVRMVVTVLWLQGAGRAARPASRSRCATGMALGRRRERGRRIEGGAPRRPVQFQGSGSPPSPTKPIRNRDRPVPTGELGRRNAPGARAGLPPAARRPGSAGRRRPYPCTAARPSFRDDAIAAASSHRAGGEPGAAAGIAERIAHSSAAPRH